ncbi:MAG: efflux RND transporter periplasmic adaptor subunit [Gemmataceae bacterium]|nr:efflux RND transporter periplasmic adaptor subunit [Gemmataceae bacterium]
MKFRAGLISGILATIAVGGLLALAWSGFSNRTKKTEAAKTAPATILKEEDILTITLTPEAEKRLGIEVGKVKEGSALRTRTFGGDVTTPPGQAILVAAPLSGTIKAPASGVPRAGTKVTKGQPVFQLLPLLSPDAKATLTTARVEAEGQVGNARVAVANAKLMLDRAEQLFNREAGSQRAVDDAKAVYDTARKTLEAAQARTAILAQAVGDANKGTAAALNIEAPTDGILRTVSVSPEENVPPGAPLFDVVNLDPVWVRVPVFVGETSELVIDQASVGPLNLRPGSKIQVARSVTAPPSANAIAGTVDLFFTLPNSDGKLSPGQRVGVTLMLKEEANDLTVPWSAVIHDIHGGSWVYVTTTPHAYSRRRVQVRHVHDGQAVLKTEPAKGMGLRKDMAVVIVGAQELFGTEVGNGK